MWGETLTMGLAFAAGIVAACLYFAGLWYTVRRLAGSRHPLRTAAFSFAVRAGALMALFAMASRAGVYPACAALFGFVLGRHRAVRHVSRGRPPGADAADAVERG